MMLSDDVRHLSDVWRLSVCLSVAYIGPKSRTERPRKTKIGSSRHMWLGYHFRCQKVKGQGHPAALLTAALTRKAAAAVSVGTYWAWETILLRCDVLGGARRFGTYRGRRGAGAYRGGRPPRACLYCKYL